MPNYRERLQWANISMMAIGHDAPLVSQFVLELANANPMGEYRFHIYADVKAEAFLKDFFAANGILDMVIITNDIGSDRFGDWWHSKDVFVGFPMQDIPDTAYLEALGLGLAVFIPFSRSKLYEAIDKQYKWQTVNDLVSTILAQEYTSAKSQELSLQLAKLIA